MAKITIKPVEPLEIEFADGTKIYAIFNNEALIQSNSHVKTWSNLKYI